MNNEIQITTDKALSLYTQDTIQQKIYTIRGVQVMLDRDLATLYQVETKVLNQAVKRNIKRFPSHFMFQLTKEEWDCLRSQIVTTYSHSVSGSYVDSDVLRSQIVTIEKPQDGRGKHLKYMPYAFTEQGVSQLSSVLKSDWAIEMSIRIIDAFVAMRRFIMNNAGIFQRLEAVELKQIATDDKIDEILNRLDDGSLKQKLGIFFDGQMFDAFVLIEELIQKANRRIVLIDDYINANVLQRFHKRSAGVTLDCYVKSRFATQDLQDAFANYNTQYPIEVTTLHTFERSHDRWLIIDDTVYHFGASIKDLGKRWFSVDVITEQTADDLISRL